MSEEMLMHKVSMILGVPLNRIQWDLSRIEIIEMLVNQIDKIVDEIGVNVYER